MKIVFFARRFYPLIGGVEKHVLEISKRLIEKGHKITVITELGKDGGRSEEFSVYRGINIYRIPITTNEKLKKFIIWKWLWHNRKLIEEADIVHCHDVYYWYLFFRFLYPRKKVFTTFHGYEGSEPPKLNQVLSHKMADYLSFGTIAIGKWHEKWYKIKSDEISYGAAEESDKDRDRVEKNEKTYDFVFIGRLAKDTGIMVYLKALEILKNKGRNYSLVVCGEGPQMSEAIEFSKKNCLKVNFAGFVENVNDYTNKSRYVFVSRYLGILEAFLKEKLIFAVYDNQIKKDYLEMSPFAKYILIGKDAVVLAEKIRYFEIRPRKSKEKIKKGFAWAKLQTWNKLTNQYLSLWERTKFR